MDYGHITVGLEHNHVTAKAEQESVDALNEALAANNATEAWYPLTIENGVLTIDLAQVQFVKWEKKPENKAGFGLN